MTLSKEQRAEFEALARPLIKWLNDNTYPHCHIVIDTVRAEISESLAAFMTEEYFLP